MDMNQEQQRKAAWLGRAGAVQRQLEAIEVLQKRDAWMETALGTVLPGKSGEALGRLRGQLQEEIEGLLRQEEEIRQAVGALEDAELSALLTRRFLCGQSTQETADAMHYDIRTIQRKQLRALDALRLPEQETAP